MAQAKGLRLTKQQRDALERMDRQDVADNESEAARMALDAGLAELGFAHDSTRETWLQWFVGELAKVLAFLAVGWLGATLYAPVGFRLLAVYLFLASVACFGMERLLKRTAPEVAERLGRGEKA